MPFRCYFLRAPVTFSYIKLGRSNELGRYNALRLSFEIDVLLRFIFLPFCCIGTAQIFIPFPRPFLPFALRARSNAKILKLVDLFISPGQTDRAGMSAPSGKRKAPADSTGASVRLT